MTSLEMSKCLTCNGAGEAATEHGPQPCPDCFGAGKALSQGTKLEWRMREIERRCKELGRDGEADVHWLVHELRRSREALLQILARCQDADPDDLTARDIKFQANDALGVYDPTGREGS